MAKTLRQWCFKLPFDLKQNKKDPMRGFTLKTQYGKRFSNRLDMVYDLSLIILKKLSLE